ncbi:MAG: tetratricopeptide repeat protein, partial [Candidatus Caldarchaeum sp.]
IVVSVREEYLWAKLHAMDITEASPFEEISHLFVVPDRSPEDYRVEWAPGWRLPPFSRAEAEAVYQKYLSRSPEAPLWHHLSSKLQEILLQPLHLYLWFDIAAQKKSQKIERLYELYEHFIENELRRFPALREFLWKVAGYILQAGHARLAESEVSQIESDPLMKTGEKLVASGFFVKQVTSEGSFYVSRYEKLLEVLLAYYLEKSTQPLTPSVVKSWLALPAFEELNGALAILAEKFWFMEKAELLLPYLETELGRQALARAMEQLILQKYPHPEKVFSALAASGEADALFGCWNQAYGEAQAYVPSAALEVWLQVIQTTNLLEKVSANRQAAFYNRSASLYERTGRLAAATEAAEKALALREALYQQDPHNTAVANDLATVCNNLAALYEKQGRASEAEALYQKAMALREQLYQQDPRNTAVANGLATVYNNLASLYQEQKKYAQAIALRERVIALYQERSPSPDTRRRLADAWHFLARTHQLAGATEQARDAYHEALRLRESLWDEAAAPLELREGLTFTLLRLGEVYERMGESATAEAFYLRAAALWAEPLLPESAHLRSLLQEKAEQLKARHTIFDRLWQRLTTAE